MQVPWASSQCSCVLRESCLAQIRAPDPHSLWDLPPADLSRAGGWSRTAECGQGPGHLHYFTLLPTWFRGPGQCQLPSFAHDAPWPHLPTVATPLLQAARGGTLKMDSPSSLPQGPRELWGNSPSASRTITRWVSNSLPSPWLPLSIVAMAIT